MAKQKINPHKLPLSKLHKPREKSPDNRIPSRSLPNDTWESGTNDQQKGDIGMLGTDGIPAPYNPNKFSKRGRQ